MQVYELRIYNDFEDETYTELYFYHLSAYKKAEKYIKNLINLYGEKEEFYKAMENLYHSCFETIEEVLYCDFCEHRIRITLKDILDI